MKREHKATTLPYVFYTDEAHDYAGREIAIPRSPVCYWEREISAVPLDSEREQDCEDEP
jgi:hypothetical protein